MISSLMVGGIVEVEVVVGFGMVMPGLRKDVDGGFDQRIAAVVIEQAA